MANITNTPKGCVALFVRFSDPTKMFVLFVLFAYFSCQNNERIARHSRG